MGLFSLWRIAPILQARTSNFRTVVRKPSAMQIGTNFNPEIIFKILYVAKIPAKPAEPKADDGKAGENLW